MLAEMVTVDVPGGVLRLVPIVRVTVIGLLAVGLTEADGEKLQLAPEGSPLHESETIPLNDPEAVTANVMFCEVLGRLTVTEPGEGAPRPKSTTCRVSGKSCVTVLLSLPTPCALKE